MIQSVLKADQFAKQGVIAAVSARPRERASDRVRVPRYRQEGGMRSSCPPDSGGALLSEPNMREWNDGLRGNHSILRESCLRQASLRAVLTGSGS